MLRKANSGWYSTIGLATIIPFLGRGADHGTQRDNYKKWLPDICRAVTFERETQSIHGDPAEGEQEINILTLMISTYPLIFWGVSH